ncbi:MAG: DUF4160 domain-containing protein [Acidimicrobiales bacterium]
MTKYPNNPLWCQRHDRPYAILTRRDWDDAVASGHLTTEHVLVRVENALDYEFGRGAELGLDEDGFYRALVADGSHHEGGISIVLHPNDHPPPHVHIRFRSDPSIDLRMSIETGELLDGTAPPGWAKRVRKATGIVRGQSELLMTRWAEMQAAVQPFA